MRKTVSLLGKKAIPIWLAIVVLAACGMGAAAGTVLSGKVTGDVPVAVSQALLTEAPLWNGPGDVAVRITSEAVATQQVFLHRSFIALPNRYFSAAADDNTAFTAAAEVAVGDWVMFSLPLKNASEVGLVGMLTLNVPECVEVEVFSTGVNVTNVVRTGLNTWMFNLAAGAHYVDIADSLSVVISIDDDCAPGYYDISGTIKQIAIQ